MTQQTEPPDVMCEKRVAQLAYEYWKQRGRPFGSPEVDWLLAEQEIKREIEPFCRPI